MIQAWPTFVSFITARLVIIQIDTFRYFLGVKTYKKREGGAEDKTTRGFTDLDHNIEATTSFGSCKGKLLLETT